MICVGLWRLCFVLSNLSILRSTKLSVGRLLILLSSRRMTRPRSHLMMLERDVHAHARRRGCAMFQDAKLKHPRQ